MPLYILVKIISLSQHCFQIFQISLTYRVFTNCSGMEGPKIKLGSDICQEIMLLALVTQTSFICSQHPICIDNQAQLSCNRVSLSSSQRDNWMNLLWSLSVLVYKYSVGTRVLLSYYSVCVRVCVCLCRIDPSAHHVFHPSVTQEGHLWDLSANHNH